MKRSFSLVAVVASICVLSLILPGAGTAQETSLSPQKIKQIEEILTAKMSKDRIPGLSIAIGSNGKVIWSNGYGLSDLENNVPAKASTVYRTASIGKSITATAVMQLVEKGKIDLDAPIQRYCPSFPQKPWKLTTRHLLSHLGGIRHYGGPRNDQEVFNTRHYNSITESLEQFKDDPLVHEPGTAFLYSTHGYTVLGCVIEGASGMPYMDYMKANIFQPAGMLQTREDDPLAIIPNRAAGYQRTAKGELQKSRAVDMSSKLPAGGFVTTAGDLASFALAMMNGTLVKPATLEQMLTPQKTADGKISYYGFGWLLFDDLWYGEKEAVHGGGTPTVTGMLYIIPRRGFSVAFLMNLEDVDERVEIAAKIAKIVLDLKK